MAKRLLNLETREHEWVLSEQEYEQLKEDSDFLECLRAAGVDNWEGYSVALRLQAGDISEDY